MIITKKTRVMWIIFILILLIIGSIFAITTVINKQKTLPTCDFDCFIKASETCAKANTTKTTKIDLFGLSITTTSYLEIKGFEENNCVFFMRIEKYDVEFPPGIPEETINQQKETYKQFEGKDMSCKLDINKLTLVLSRWKNESYSTKDWEDVDCQGSLLNIRL